MRIFLEQIQSGIWQLGQQIPTEENLCKKYNVSKITVRQAVNNLVVHRLFFSSDNASVAYTKIQGRSDRYKFQAEFERIR